MPTTRLPSLRRVIWSSLVILIKAEANNVGRNRLAVAVPAKRIKLAVDRHRLKRQILAAAARLPNHSEDLLLVFQGKKKPTIAEWRAEFDKIKRKV